MSGIDEPSARSALAEMQDRLARDPTSALGVAANASPEDIRSAFLELTKLFHPVRFGRMSSDVQKLSNEVFLALRSAHDALAKSARRASGGFPTVMPSAPAAMTGAPTARFASPGPIGPVAAPAVHVGHAAPRPGTAPAPLQAPVQARSMPPRPADASSERLPVLPRTITPSAPGAFKGAPTRPLSAPASRPPAAAPARPAAPAGPPASEAAVLELLQRQQFDPAKSMLHQLQAKDPSSRKVRALMSYARGREAQLERRLDDARVELQDALELDPELALAKTALTELFTRRR